MTDELQLVLQGSCASFGCVPTEASRTSRHAAGCSGTWCHRTREKPAKRIRHQSLFMPYQVVRDGLVLAGIGQFADRSGLQKAADKDVTPANMKQPDLGEEDSIADLVLEPATSSDVSSVLSPSRSLGTDLEECSCVRAQDCVLHARETDHRGTHRA